MLDGVQVKAMEKINDLHDFLYLLNTGAIKDTIINLAANVAAHNKASESAIAPGGFVMLNKLAGEQGFEPQLPESESGVLPLNYSPPISATPQNRPAA